MCQPNHDTSEGPCGSSRPPIVVGYPMGGKRVCVRRRVELFPGDPRVAHLSCRVGRASLIRKHGRLRSRARLFSDVEPGSVKGERRVRVLSALDGNRPRNVAFGYAETIVTRIGEAAHFVFSTFGHYLPTCRCKKVKGKWSFFNPVSVEKELCDDRRLDSSRLSPLSRTLARARESSSWGPPTGASATR